MSVFDRPNWFAVAQIITGEIVYVGCSLHFCADALQPGHCYVAGYSEDEVRRGIRAEIRRFRQNREAA